ncbi:MAG: hypothetical protein E6Q76_05740 [Rhizobium sp.]|nr:MAG: hypothetical protein E6Q76_05740 [Rhizobium sp.]
MLINQHAAKFNGAARLQAYLKERLPGVDPEASELQPLVSKMLASMEFDQAKQLEPESLLKAGQALRDGLAEMVIDITPFDALNAVARVCGYPEWDSMFEAIAQDIDRSTSAAPDASAVAEVA